MGGEGGRGAHHAATLCCRRIAASSTPIDPSYTQGPPDVPPHVIGYHELKKRGSKERRMTGLGFRV